MHCDLFDAKKNILFFTFNFMVAALYTDLDNPSIQVILVHKRNYHYLWRTMKILKLPKNSCYSRPRVIIFNISLLLYPFWTSLILLVLFIFGHLSSNCPTQFLQWFIGRSYITGGCPEPRNINMITVTMTKSRPMRQSTLEARFVCCRVMI